MYCPPTILSAIDRQSASFSLADNLTDRDRAVLANVDRYGFLTTKQIERLHFTTYSSPQVTARVCRRDLKRLRDHRLLEPLQRRIGGLRAGSASYVWRLGSAGDKLRRLAEPDTARARRKEPSWRFLDHRLAVAEVACQLTEADRADQIELVVVAPEPDSWRHYSDGYGNTETLKPDLFAVTAEGDYEDHWFIEVDRDTESLPTVLGQCEQYERYRRSGSEQATTGLFPRVLWLVPDEHRAARLIESIRERQTLDTGLYRSPPKTGCSGQSQLTRKEVQMHDNSTERGYS